MSRDLLESVSARARETVARVILALFACAASSCLVACGYPPGCEGEDTAYFVGPTSCDVEECVIDFGDLAPGLSTTINFSWTGECVGFVSASASILDNGSETFFLEPPPRGVEISAVSLEAHPFDSDPHAATLELRIQGATTSQFFPLIVNR